MSIPILPYPRCLLALPFALMGIRRRAAQKLTIQSAPNILRAAPRAFSYFPILFSFYTLIHNKNNSQ